MLFKLYSKSKLSFLRLRTFLVITNLLTGLCRRLKEMLGPSGVCGKALGHGEPNFSCLDCATDLTCVMCMECYNASEHCANNHNVAVHTSAGNGMCDCGDKEAWKSVSYIA